MFIINVVIRPSNPCHRDTALCSAHRNSPYSTDSCPQNITASSKPFPPRVKHNSKQYWKVGLLPKPASCSWRCPLPHLRYKSHQHRTPPLMRSSKASCRCRTGVSGCSSSLGSLELQEQPGKGLIKPSGGLSLNY